MKKRSGIFISLLLAGTLAIAGCGNKQPKLSGDEAKEALNNAEKLYFTGNLSDVILIRTYQQMIRQRDMLRNQDLSQKIYSLC